MTKSFTNTTIDALALATRVATEKMARKSATPATPEATAPKVVRVQFNINLSVTAREQLRDYAYAARTTERELIEAFAAQLPKVPVSREAPPLPWVFPPEKMQ